MAAAIRDAAAGAGISFQPVTCPDTVIFLLKSIKKRKKTIFFHKKTFF